MRGRIAILILFACGSVQAGPIYLKRATLNLNASTEQKLWSQTFTRQQNEEAEYIVQFRHVISANDQSVLHHLGITTRGYIPENALLVVAHSNQIEHLKKSLSSLEAVVPFLPEWKVSDEFGSVSVFNADTVERVVVKVQKGVRSLDLSQTLSHVSHTHVIGVDGSSIILDVQRGSLSKVAAVNGVEWVQKLPEFVNFALPMAEEDKPVESKGGDYTDLTGFETGTRLMNLDAAWARGYTGAGQVAGMADTGLDTGDLKTLLRDYPGVREGIPVGLFSQTWNDPQGHGTHVTGSVISNGTVSGGKLKGAAPGAAFVAQSMWSPMLDNLSVPQNLNTLMDGAYQKGVRIHTNSWGNPSNLGAYDTFASQADEAMWNHPDLLILFAAGNSGVDANRDGRIDSGSVSTPGTAKNILTVGASENLLLQGGIQKTLSELRDGTKNWGVEPLKSDLLSNNADGIAAFSSRGPTQDGRLKPEVVAPGTNIVSGRSQDPKAGTLWGAYNQYYSYSGGTSMATPLAAGAATVARDFLVRARGLKQPSGALVKALMIHSSHDLFPGQYGKGPQQELQEPRPNIHEGYGRVDMDAATGLAADTQVIDETSGINVGGEKTYAVSVNDSPVLRVTLAYTDAPGLASASKALVNDLDIEIVDPQGHVTSKNDHLNPTEMIELPHPTPGQYTVRVRGGNVPQGKSGLQPFALIISTR